MTLAKLSYLKLPLMVIVETLPITWITQIPQLKLCNNGNTRYNPQSNHFMIILRGEGVPLEQYWYSNIFCHLYIVLSAFNRHTWTSFVWPSTGKSRKEKGFIVALCPLTLMLFFHVRYFYHSLVYWNRFFNVVDYVIL